MSAHNLPAEANRADLVSGDLLFYIPSEAQHLIKIGTGVPSGTPDAKIYLNLSGTTAATIFYGDVAGTWTAWTIS